LVPDAWTPLPKRAYRVKDLVYLLGVPRSTLYDLIARGDLRAVTLGRGRRKLLLVPAEEIERLLNPPKSDPEVDDYLLSARPGLAKRPEARR
jgi:excisionase family DNA binding protein